MDTLTQPLKEEYACAFSPDGRSIVAGGADNTIRVWEFASTDGPRINPMTLARFAHEGPIVRLAFTPDGSRLITTAEDRTIKVWDTADYTELKLWEHEPDVADAIAALGRRPVDPGRPDGRVVERPTPSRPSASGSRESASEAREAAVRRDRRGRPEARRRAGAQRPGGPGDRPGRSRRSSAGPSPVEPPARPDSDLFRFTAKAGESWVVEVDAARSGSKLDSFVEVLDAQGRRIERVRLQAVLRLATSRSGARTTASAADFRLFSQDEMHLNDYLYANGEVVKLWLYPRGPDSGFLVYPGSGKRWGYFDTTPLTHALGEPCYVVRPHPPAPSSSPTACRSSRSITRTTTSRIANSARTRSSPSHAPVDGQYLVRVRDVRGLEGADFSYKLTIRPSRPDFQRHAQGAEAVDRRRRLAGVPAQRAKRLDGYEGPIRVDLEGMPPGFSATSPMVIEAGQIEALGVDRRPSPTPRRPRPSSSRRSGSRPRPRSGAARSTHPVNPLGPIKLAEKPQLRLQDRGPPRGGPAGPRVARRPALEFEIHPGQTIELKVRVERNGHVGQVPLGNEGAGRNLPFGVIVDNIGLNGLLITEKQDERTFFLTADRSVPPQSRPFHLTTTAAGGQSSLPVILHVR